MSYLAIDCGTSGCRAAVVSAGGRILSLARRRVAVARGGSGRAEMAPDEVWRAAVAAAGAALRRARAALERDRVRGVGVSTLLGYVLLDRSGRPLAPAVVYMDARAATELEEIGRRFPSDRLYRSTRRRPSAELLAPVLLWHRRHRPALWARVRKAVGLKDEIVRRLTGHVGTDLAHLNYTLLFDVRRGRLDADLLQGLKIDPELFPPPVPADETVGGLTPQSAAEIGLPAGLPVICGSSDGTTAMYGAGVLQDGAAVLMSGTTDVLMTACRRIPADRSRTLTVNSGMAPGVYLAGGATGLAGGAVRYFEELLGVDARRLSDRIGRLPPGSAGLTVRPGLTGERAPFWSEGRSGAVLGLTLEHGPEHLLRATMEGSVLRLVQLVDRLRRCGLQPRRLHVAGGWSDVEAWNRIRADAIGLEVRCTAEREATLLGTAMFCASGVDGVPLAETARRWVRFGRRFRPRPNTAGGTS